MEAAWRPSVARIVVAAQRSHSSSAKVCCNLSVRPMSRVAPAPSAAHLRGVGSPHYYHFAAVYTWCTEVGQDANGTDERMPPVLPRQAVRLCTVRAFASDAKEKDDAAKASEARQEEHAEAAATGCKLLLFASCIIELAWHACRCPCTHTYSPLQACKFARVDSRMQSVSVCVVCSVVVAVCVEYLQRSARP